MKTKSSKHRILVLGASGFIGNAIYKELCSYFRTYATYCVGHKEFSKNKHFFQYNIEEDDIHEILKIAKPTIIISARAAIKSVPPSIREAAYGLGASKNQVVFHHVLPLAMPGMLTGTILGMAQALGETAPLLMIGMVAFVVDVPGFINDPSTAINDP